MAEVRIWENADGNVRKCAFFVKFLFLFLQKMDIISFDC